MMFTAIVTFLVLGLLLYMLERDRAQVDGFSVGIIAAIPVVLSYLSASLLDLVTANAIIEHLVPLAVLLGATFGLLLRVLMLPVARALGYTAVVLAINVAIDQLLVAA